MDLTVALPLLPVATIEAVEKAFLNTFGTTNLDSITQLTGGLSTALVFKIVVADRSYLLRIMLHTDALNDPARLFTCMKIAADAGIAPRLIYSDVDSAISITDFVEAQPLGSRLARYEETVVELAQTVKRIHALPLFPKLINFMDGVDGFISNFKASGRLPAQTTAVHFQLYAHIQQVYPRHDTDLVSSHNDLNYNNILFDGTKIWIIDWEAAFPNDRYVDLANVANGFVTTHEQEEIYLRAYFGDTLDEYKRARFFLMQQACHFFYAMIMLNMIDARLPKGIMLDDNMVTPTYAEFRQQVGAGQVHLATNDGQLLFAKVVLNEALQKMQSARFDQAIARIKKLA